MTRRIFQQTISAGVLGYLTQPWSGTSPLQKPKLLVPGDAIGLIAPGSAVPSDKIERAVQTCLKLGLVPMVSAKATMENGYLAGTDEERLEDLHAAFADPKIKGVWCLRGGYGCSRLLPEIDLELIRKNPKILIGYSDITAFHQIIGRYCNLVTFHGPVATSEPTEFSISMFQRAIMSGSPFALQSTDEAQSKSYVIKEGSAQGKLTGGNLSLLAALAGTPYLDSFAGKIVCIEDIGEKPYRIDRMLVQLFQATDLSKAAGIVLGQFNDCEAKPGEKSLSLEQTLRHQFVKFTGPVFYGFSMGHIDDQCTIPFGIPARFNTEEKILHLLEAPTQS